MARLPRLTLPGYPHHVIQRGNNRQAIFASTADYQVLLDLLRDNAQKFGVAIHAYVLMSNHFHLLATPQTADGLPQMMQAVGRSYVRTFNNAQGRTGTLWEGRYRSTLIQSERYLLACMVYIDLNPVRAGLWWRRQPTIRGPATGTTSGAGSTNWSRRIRCSGNSATRRLPGRRRTPNWCMPASPWRSRTR
jgi:REP element-mobilizing transposase RayT